jgi:pilus assembly protein Flp/PilA
MMDVILWSVVQGQNAFARLRDEERGQGLVEYALIIAVVALGVLLAIIFLRDQISNLFNRAGSELSSPS